VDDKLVTIAKFSDSYQANLAKQLLADFGIEAIVLGENFANLYAALPLQAITLQVRENQSRQAQEILESGDTQDDVREDFVD
jgi:hypothetical protein